MTCIHNYRQREGYVGSWSCPICADQELQRLQAECDRKEEFLDGYRMLDDLQKEKIKELESQLAEKDAQIAELEKDYEKTIHKIYKLEGQA